MDNKKKTPLLACEIIKGRDLVNTRPSPPCPKFYYQAKQQTFRTKTLAVLPTVCIAAPAAFVVYGFHFQEIRIYTVMPRILHYLVGVLKRMGSLVVE